MKKQYFGHLLGQWDPASFSAAVTFAFIGAFLLMLLHTTARNVASPRTPVSFDWKFFFCDNTKRIVASVILIFVSIRFLQPLCTFIGLQQDNMLVSFFLGAISDALGIGFQALVRRYSKLVISLAEKDAQAPTTEKTN